MFGKVMSISDELMWRYYELLTDLTAREIEQLKQAVAKGDAHPMKLKQDLGKHIVADFHGFDAAEQAAQGWSRMFQKDEVPEDLPLVSVKLDEVVAPNAAISADGVVQVKLDKLLARTGLATSVSDGVRKVKQNAVKLDGELKTELVATVKLGSEFTLRAGKKMVRVVVEG
jgi:tyrosyl-tRNA synthetase